jgi:IS5 family transposase
VPTRVWRQLLDRSATRCDPGEHGALDATFFDGEAASSHYRHRSDRRIQTLKATAPVDAESCSVLNLHCSAHWPHDTQVGRQVALRNTDDIESLAGDKGYDDQSLRDVLRAEGVRPLLRHRVFAPYNHANNARLDSDLYGQRWMAETAFSSIRRRYGASVRSRAWYRQFRNSYSLPLSTTSNKPSRSDPYAVRGFNRVLRYLNQGGHGQSLSRVG